MAVLDVAGLRKVFGHGDEAVVALAHIALSADALLAISSARRATGTYPARRGEGSGGAVRGDPTAPRAIQAHQTRRVVVPAVWEQERHERTAADIVANLQHQASTTESRTKARGPKPRRKRLSARVEQDVNPRIAEAFDEADRRDPERRRDVVALVDGDPHQTEAILQQARQRQRSLTLVLDLLHAMRYLGLAAAAILSQNDQCTKAAIHNLVTHWTIMLLTGNPSRVIAATRGTAIRRGCTGKARKTVDDAADYLQMRLAFVPYARFISMGLPIASGVIEGGCRHVVRDRLDITGARWNVQVAEAVLRLRAARNSGDWDDYWRFHQQQEARRNYAAAA